METADLKSGYAWLPGLLLQLLRRPSHGLRMRALRLREMTGSWYFWPSIALLGLAVGMAAWAAALAHEDWLGQAMWSAFFAMIGVLLLVLAFRESRPEPQRTVT